jgi:HlyD family secretion protein
MNALKSFALFVSSLGFILSLAGWNSCLPGNAATAKPMITGLIDATEIDVASKVPGRIREIHVLEGSSVHEGDIIATIESDEIQAKINQVNAAIAAAEAKLQLARRGARDEEKNAVGKELDAAREQVEITKKMYDRLLPLIDQQAIPQAKFDEVEFKYHVARDQLAMAEAKYAIVNKGARDEEINALTALVQQGQGTLQEINAYNRETTQLAPISGEVSKIILRRGELAATGYPIVTLVDLHDIWATFAVREDMLKNLHPGQELSLFIPALGQNITMKIFNISAMGDFATWKATSEKNSFDLKSFEVKARPISAVAGLRPGMTVRWYPN